MGKNKPSPIITLQSKKLIPFGWYGGKFSHLDWLLPLLPECHHYCEPFAGSGAVLLNRKPSKVETYNDLDGEVVNFFKVLRSVQNVWQIIPEDVYKINTIITEVRFSDILLIFICSQLVCLISCLLPAWRALKLPLKEGLLYE